MVPVLGALTLVMKPVVYLWVGLNVIDDLAMVMRAGRLVAVVLPGGERSDLCDVCDDLMEDLLRGTEGLSVLPCAYGCLRIPACMRMCEAVKAASLNSTHFPCIAAGYCDDEEGEGSDAADIECKTGPLFSCKPARYCKRHRAGLRMSCNLRPGIGRWIGMRNAVGTHAVALADGLLSQPHCGEPNAGPYCIAEPKGWGAVAEAVGHVLSLGYGGLKTVGSIETPGGDDDRQWLTFWLILTMLLFVERFLARVVLSTFPLYYEAKLALLVWLLWGGADEVYRKLRRLLVRWFGEKFVKTEKTEAESELKLYQSDCPSLVAEALAEERARRNRASMRSSAHGPVPGSIPTVSGGVALPPVPDRSSSVNPPVAPVSVDAEADLVEVGGRVPLDDPCEQLRVVSAYTLSAKGRETLQRDLNPSAANVFVNRAASLISFEPRFVHVELIGIAEDTLAAELPAMDANERADAYVVCYLEGTDGIPYPESGIRSRPAFRTVRPRWNQTLELPLRGGAIDSDGIFRYAAGAGPSATTIRMQVIDADVGFYGWLLIAAQLAAVALGVAALVAYVTGAADNFSRKQVRRRLLSRARPLFPAIIASCHAAQEGRGAILSSHPVRSVRAQVRLFVFSASAVMASLFGLYVAARRLRCDDDLIGECSVPVRILCPTRRPSLAFAASSPPPPHPHPAPSTFAALRRPPQVKMLLDQKEHELLLTLRPVAPSTPDTPVAPSSPNSPGGLSVVKRKVRRALSSSKKCTGKTNSAGGLGVIRVKVSCSER